MLPGLEETAGVQPQRIAYVHGSLKFATCETCRRKVNSADFEDDIRAGRVARCRRRHQNNNRTTTPTRTGTRTSARKKRARDPDNNISSNNSSSSMPSNVCGGVLKPGVTFFGEALQDSVKTKLEADREKVDALIVIGTSLSVYVCWPFRSLPGCPLRRIWLTVSVAANCSTTALPFPRSLTICPNRYRDKRQTKKNIFV